jgi:hypothetical protein
MYHLISGVVRIRSASQPVTGDDSSNTGLARSPIACGVLGMTD